MIDQLDTTSITSLTSGGGIAIAAYAAVQFGRLVGAALRLASAAQSWLERHEELHTSTVEHHQRMAAKADKLIDHAQAHRSLLLRILSRRPTPTPPPTPASGTAAAAR